MDKCPKCGFASKYGNASDKMSAMLSYPNWYGYRWHPDKTECSKYGYKSTNRKEHIHHYCMRCNWDFIGEIVGGS